MMEMSEEFDFENRIMTTSYTKDDSNTEPSLRPKTLDDYIGQEKVKENLKIYIEAAKMRGESLDHVLLYGPPGLGTSISGVTPLHSSFDGDIYVGNITTLSVSISYFSCNSPVYAPSLYIM